ncbi:hypothetical protein Afil01_33780 [Actinorhabdospora filicis]|uniref:Uncharacterized protein n=1 Tax=Actinorhabdospora filicis TaxID=1785913 RepID=A0A9W6SMI4_9ACTN|nr:hypothetical protein [Actinorhabdospora filicis]GLZ78571.1 hypothetical protein Afil01_33780 [Actinorhabdospora filicis]
MLIGTRTGFGLDFHIERDPGLLCADIFIGGLHVNTWDNAFYPPLLVRCLTEEAARFGAPAEPVAGFTSPREAFGLAEHAAYDDATGRADLVRCAFLEWGECTEEVTAFAFPDGDRVHLACRVRDGGGPAWGTPARDEPTVASVSRIALAETLAAALAVAEREWAVRLAAIKARD